MTAYHDSKSLIVTQAKAPKRPKSRKSIVLVIWYVVFVDLGAK